MSLLKTSRFLPKPKPPPGPYTFPKNQKILSLTFRKALQNQSALAVDQGVHPCAVEEVLEATVEERPEVVGDLVTGGEEEVEVAEEEVVEEEGVGSALIEAEQEEAAIRILQEQEHSEGAVRSQVVRSLALHVQRGDSARKSGIWETREVEHGDKSSLLARTISV